MAVAVRGADDGALRAGVVAEGVGADRRLRRARPRQHVQVRRAAPAARPDHRGTDLRQQRHLAGPRRVHEPPRPPHRPP